MPNLPYFRSQWVYTQNLERLNPNLVWHTFSGNSTQWLAHTQPDDLYSEDDLGPLGIIFLGQLGDFVNLTAARNRFNLEKPEFSLQLRVEEGALDVLKTFLRRRDPNLTVTNPLRIKAAESDITLPSFTRGDSFPFTFDGTSTDDDQDGDSIPAYRFASGDRVAVQAWFGSYIFSNASGKTSSGPTFRLLKIWRLQPAAARPSSLNYSPVTKRRRVL